MFRLWLLSGLGLVALAALTTMSAIATNLPPGFSESQYVSMTVPSNSAPGSFAFAPDGSLWITQHTGSASPDGNVWVHRAGNMTLALTVAVIQGGERGIHTVAIDPDYLTNGHVWLYFTSPGPPIRNRLSRFTNVADQLQNEVVILDGPEVQCDGHNGGCLAFADDKTLFLGVGDDCGGGTFAQDPFELRGKILHLNRDGTPAADNPYLDGTLGDPRVWALGLRNPFRCRMQPETDNLFITDVGAAAWEEIDIGFAGANFGWSQNEGPEPPGTPGMTYPIYSYPHAGLGAAVIGGAHAEPGDFNPIYEGNFFYGDYARNEIRRVVLDENQNVEFVELFATETSPRISDLDFGPDGALYYTRRGGISQPAKGIYRIEYVGGGNTQPVAVATATPDSGDAPLNVVLDGSQSYDLDDDTLSFAWDPGDGGTATGPLAPYIYPQGVYEARLTVDDGNGLTATSPLIRIVSGNNKPTTTITAPVDGAKYNAGDVVSYSGSGSDPEDGPLSCSQFTWQVIFHHDNHTHPFLGPLQGSCSGSFQTVVLGETDPNVWHEIRLTVQDLGTPIGPGAELSQATSVEIFPNYSMITLESLPEPDLTLELDTVPATAPHTAQSVVGLTRKIGVVDGQVKNGRSYRWLSWSDNGSLEHEITTPLTDTTYVATFGCNVIATVDDLVVSRDASGELTLTWSPVVDSCLATGSDVYRVYVADTAVPASPPGEFPLDPGFQLVGTSSTEMFSYFDDPEHRYFIVVAVGTDLLNGESEHY